MGATWDEARVRLKQAREAVDAVITAGLESPRIINAVSTEVRPWTPGAYALNEVRAFDGVPYRCCQAHDSTGNTGWTPAASPALWAQYHGTSVATARAWVAPTGAHDAYRLGEYVIYNGSIYTPATDNMIYAPDAYAQGWRSV